MDTVDVGIYTSNIIPSGYHSEQLFRIYDFAVCKPSLLEGKGKFNSAEDLLHLPLLHESSSHWWPIWLEAAGCKDKPDSHGRVAYNESPAVAGLGVTLGDNISTSALIRDGTLVQVVPETMETNVWVHLLIKLDKLKEPNITRFQTWLSQSILTTTYSD